MPPHVKCTPVRFMWCVPRKWTWWCSRRPSRRTPVPKARSMERRKGRRRRSRGAIVSSVARVAVHYIRTETYTGSRKSFARELRVGTTLPTYSAVLCRVHIHNLPMRISMHYSSAGQLVVALLRKEKKRGLFIDQEPSQSSVQHDSLCVYAPTSNYCIHPPCERGGLLPNVASCAGYASRVPKSDSAKGL